jgi:hypothetical protein
MALREIMRVPTDKLSMMAASEVGQNGPSVKTERDGDQPEAAGDQPEAAAGDQPEGAAGDHPEAAAGDQPEAAAGDQPEADDTMDNDGGDQDVNKLEDREAVDRGRVATKLSKWRKLRICTN